MLMSSQYICEPQLNETCTLTAWLALECKVSDQNKHSSKIRQVMVVQDTWYLNKYVGWSKLGLDSDTGLFVAMATAAGAQMWMY